MEAKYHQPEIVDMDTPEVSGMADTGIFVIALADSYLKGQGVIKPMPDLSVAACQLLRVRYARGM
jgi:hypothetical protein